MGIFLTFLPWIAQGVLSSISFSLAITVSLGLSFLSLLRSKYIIEWTTFLFFLITFVVSFFVEELLCQNVVSLLSTVTLCLVSWVSLLRNNPFTLHYAKERVPEKYWNSPLFLKVNTIMTTAFGVIFSLQVLLKIAKILSPEALPYSGLSNFLSVAIVLFVSHFPEWYTKRAKRKKQLPSGGDFS